MRASTWGWLPWLAPVAALGLVMMALANSASVSSRSYAMLLFWAGVLIIALPVALRMLNPEITRQEALGLLILVGEIFFMGTISGTLAGHTGYDELLHWRTASDILTTGHLFTPNSLLPVSPYYPGLEIVTTTVAGLTGLSIYPAGFVVVFIARLIMLVSLFSIFLNISGSVRAAALGGLIYMGSTTFFFFDSQFAYESLSLPLAALVLWMALKLSRGPGDQRFGWSASILLVEIMVAITHHVTSFFLAGILLLWTALATLRRWGGRGDFIPYRVSNAMLIIVLAWLLL
ncbi:MAG TPA: hypothetical protein VF813_06320, partial [Anaerolineaceae bacterium]